MKAWTKIKLLLGLVLLFLLVNGWRLNPFYGYEACSEKTETLAGEFERPFTPLNSGLMSRFIRTIKMTPFGLWIGYAGHTGIGLYDGEQWINWTFCGDEEHVNSFAWSSELGLWAGTDSQSGKNGLLHFENGIWYDLTSKLPDAKVYDLVIHNGCLYVSTWEGVARYCGKEWSTPYTTSRNIFNNHNHSLAFLRNEDIFFGPIDGVGTWYVHTGVWRGLVTPEMNTASAVLELTTSKVRAMREHPSLPELWIVGDGGDAVIFTYEPNESWRTVAIPGMYALDIEFDFMERPWVAGKEGMIYWEYWENAQAKLMPYDFSATALEFGCAECIFDETVGFAALEEDGLLQFSVPPVLRP